MPTLGGVGEVIIWHRGAAPVSDEPSERLTQWRIFALPNGDRHFCGIRANGRTARVSTRIVLFDTETKIGMTASGRRYQLAGPPGNATEVELAVYVWCGANGLDAADVEFVDIES